MSKGHDFEEGQVLGESNILGDQIAKCSINVAILQGSVLTEVIGRVFL